MIYLANASTPAIKQAICDGWLGAMLSPKEGRRPERGWTWAFDNNCFSDVWDPAKWVRALGRNADGPGTCLFAVVPDKLADPKETQLLWDQWSGVVRDYGYKTAYVLQDGCRRVPWDEVDCLFVGGSTEYKMSDAAYRWTIRAKERGKWVHWGRVNSKKRFAALSLTGDSCDGTFLTFGPDTNLRKLRSWVNTLDLKEANSARVLPDY